MNVVRRRYVDNLAVHRSARMYWGQLCHSKLSSEMENKKNVTKNLSPGIRLRSRQSRTECHLWMHFLFVSCPSTWDKVGVRVRNPFSLVVLHAVLLLFWVFVSRNLFVVAELPTGLRIKWNRPLLLLSKTIIETRSREPLRQKTLVPPAIFVPKKQLDRHSLAPMCNTNNK